VVGHRDFHTLMEEFPEVASQLLLALAHRLRALESNAVH